MLSINNQDNVYPFADESESNDNVSSANTNDSFLNFSVENARHLERLEKDFLDSIETNIFIKGLMLTVLFNSLNVFLCLYCIKIGLGLYMSAIAGFSVGSVPSLKIVSDSLNVEITKNGGWQVSGIGINGKMLKGFIGILFTASLTFHACSEWKIIQNLSEKSFDAFNADKQKFENIQKPGLDPSLANTLYAGLGCLTVLAGLSVFRNKNTF